jgi:hypothetical protein
LHATPATIPPNNDNPERCSRHPGGNPTGEPCQGCKRIEDRKAAAADREAERRRLAEEEARRNCRMCESTGKVLDDDKMPTAKRCDHRRTA